MWHGQALHRATLRARVTRTHEQDADADAPASFHPLLHSEVRKRAIHAPILTHTLLLTIATADADPSPLTPRPLLLLVCEEQPRRTLRECVKRHPHVFPREC